MSKSPLRLAGLVVLASAPIFADAQRGDLTETSASTSAPQFSLTNYRAKLEGFDITVAPELLRKGVKDQFAAIQRDLGMLGGCERGHTNEQLDAGWYAAIWASFYTVRDEYLKELRMCFEELEARGKTSPLQVEYTYKAFVLHRAFDEAQALAESHQDGRLKPLPSYISPLAGTTPSVLKVSAAPEITMSRQPLDLGTGTKILVVALAGCQFAEKAANAIQADPQLLDAFSDSVWVTPPHDLLLYDEILGWNQRFDFAQLSVAYSLDDFVGFSLADSPTFYILKDGEIVGEMIGWDTDKQPAQALKTLLAESL